MTSQDTSHAGVTRALLAGIAANLLVALSKATAFIFTGSSAMLAEAIHSVADSSNQGLLALGMKRAAKPPSATHPFGYAKEAYFWSFMVSILVFTLGGAFALYEGVHKLLVPTEITNPAWNYGALAFGIAVESFALKVAYKEFKEIRAHHPGPLLRALSDTKDPTIPTILFEDAAAVTGLLVALMGVALTHATGNAMFDAMASMIIGSLLVMVAWFLAKESHSLLVGEAATPEAQEAIRSIVKEEQTVVSLIELLTLQRGPRSIIVALELEFMDALKTPQIERAVVRLEKKIGQAVPEATHLFIEAGSFRARQKQQS